MQLLLIVHLIRNRVLKFNKIKLDLVYMNKNVNYNHIKIDRKL